MHAPSSLRAPLAAYILLSSCEIHICMAASLDQRSNRQATSRIRSLPYKTQEEIQDDFNKQQGHLIEFQQAPTILRSLSSQNKSKTNLTQTALQNNTQFCSSLSNPLFSALVAGCYNIMFSIALSPLGFIVLFIRDLWKRGRKCCNEKIAPEQEQSAEGIPTQIVMVKNDQSEALDPDHPISHTAELKKIPFIGISEFYQSAANLFYNVGYRGVFVFVQIQNRNFVNPALFLIDICMALYFGFKKMYCPGCLYNDFHVLIYNRKFVHVR